MRRDNSKFPEVLIPTAPVVTAAGKAIRVHDVPLFERQAATICVDTFFSTTTRQTPSVEIAGSDNVPDTPEITCNSVARAVSTKASITAMHTDTTSTALRTQL